MSERMTSRAEADEMKKAIDATVDSLECCGFDRGQIGATMAGIGLALVVVHNGRGQALSILEGTRNALMAGSNG